MTGLENPGASWPENIRAFFAIDSLVQQQKLTVSSSENLKRLLGVRAEIALMDSRYSTSFIIAFRKYRILGELGSLATKLVELSENPNLSPDKVRALANKISNSYEIVLKIIPKLPRDITQNLGEI